MPAVVAALLPVFLLKLVVMPTVAIAIALGCGLSGANLSVLVCCTAVPAASNCYVLARQLGGAPFEEFRLIAIARCTNDGGHSPRQ